MGRVLIYGTNFAAYRAAMNFARAGHKVILLNRGPFLWAKPTQMQIQKPRDISTGYSKALLKIVTLLTGNVEIYHNSELLGIEGERGNFKVKFRTKSPGFEEWKCIGCDLCVEKCGAKHMPLPLSAGIYQIPPEKVEECSKICPARAISIPKEEEREEEVEVVVLAPEYEPMDISRYGYGIENVLRFDEFDKFFAGRGIDINFVRRKDGKMPRSIGFFTPAGFGDFLGSSEEVTAIFMEALLIKSLKEDINVHIFVKELRLYGKNQISLYDLALERGIKVHLIDDITVKGKDGNVVVNGVELEIFVIMPGLKRGIWDDVAKTAGIELEDGFAKTKPFSLETTRDGIFAIGEFVKPLSSTEAIYHGTAVVVEASKYLSSPPETPQQNVEWIKDDFNPRVGLFICDCAARNLNIDVDADYISRKDFLCLRAEEIIKEIKENNLNRVVFAACSPFHMGMKLEHIASFAGIHPSYVEIVQLRDWVTRVGGDDNKANAMIRAAIEKAKKDVFVDIPVGEVKRSVLIVGGSIAALIAAKHIMKRVPVYIVAEKLTPPNDATGVKRNTLNMSDDALMNWWNELKNEVLKNDNVKFIEGKIISIEGKLGQFKTRVGDMTIEHGVLIIATDGEIIEGGTHIAGRTKKNMHAAFSAILAKRREIEATYDLMKSFSLLDLYPPKAVKGEGEPIAIVKPSEENRKISEMLGLKVDEDGFFYFDECPLYHVERSSITLMIFEEPLLGVFVAGLAHYPKSIEDTVFQAEFAAQSSLYLMRDIVPQAGKWISVTNPRKCAGCGICVDACVTGARFIDVEDKIAKVHPALCMGCGACANVCPSGAATIISFSSDEIFEMIKEVVK